MNQLSLEMSISSEHCRQVMNLWFPSCTLNNQIASFLFLPQRRGKKHHDLNPATRWVFPSPLTIRKRGDGDVLGGDAGAVAVVGQEAQGVLGELLQPLEPVGEPFHLHVLSTHRQQEVTRSNAKRGEQFGNQYAAL